MKRVKSTPKEIIDFIFPFLIFNSISFTLSSNVCFSKNDVFLAEKERILIVLLIFFKIAFINKTTLCVFLECASPAETITLFLFVISCLIISLAFFH